MSVVISQGGPLRFHDLGNAACRVENGVAIGLDLSARQERDLLQFLMLREQRRRLGLDDARVSLDEVGEMLRERTRGDR